VKKFGPLLHTRELKATPEMKKPKPTKPSFDEQQDRFFEFCLEGLDPFLVEKVSFSPLRPGKRSGRISASLHHCIAPSTMQQIEELLPKQDLKIEIRRTDAAGTVVRVEEFTGVRVEKVKVPTLDYWTTGSTKINLVLAYSERTLKY
jgi:hypothetical protein